MPKMARACTKGAAGDEAGPSDTKRNVLSFTINHGDMVIMHGTEIHRYYDVSIVRLCSLTIILTWSSTW